MINLQRLVCVLLLHALPVFAGTNPNHVGNVSSTASADNLVLNWTAVNTDLYGNSLAIDHYNIYKSNTPNFIPDPNGLNRIGQPSTLSFTDIDALLDTSSDYYVVTAVAATGEESLVPSSVSGSTHLDLVYNPSGSNRYWLAVPAINPYNTASGVGNAALNISKVIRWDPLTQSEQDYDVTTVTGTDFALTPGEGVAIEITANTTLNLLGTHSTVDIPLNYNSDNFNRQWLSLPEPNAYPSASMLQQALPDASKLAITDNTNDSYTAWYQLNGVFMGADFPSSPGVSVVVSVTAASTFTAQTSVPNVAAQSTPDIGYESISISLSANAQDIDGTIDEYQWDFDGDGIFDATGATVQHTYQLPGSYLPTVLVTDNQGHRAVAYTSVSVNSLNVNISVSGFNPSLGELALIEYTLPLDGLVTINIYAQDGSLMKTLLNNSTQLAGLRSINWDGRDNNNAIVSDRDYYVSINYTVNGFTSTFDTRGHTGGTDMSTSISNISISQTLSPLSGEYVTINYVLPESGLVTVEITDANDNLVRTLNINQAQIGGLHSLVWDGADNNGFIVAPGTLFKVRVRATSLASNSLIILGTAPELSDISAAPLRFSPALNRYGVQANSSVNIQFNLNKGADVTATIYDSIGAAVRTLSAADLSAGANEISWNGRNGSNIKMATGHYIIKLEAQDSVGNLSTAFNIQTEIFY